MVNVACEYPLSICLNCKRELNAENQVYLFPPKKKSAILRDRVDLQKAVRQIYSFYAGVQTR